MWRTRQGYACEPLDARRPCRSAALAFQENRGVMHSKERNSLGLARAQKHNQRPEKRPAWAAVLFLINLGIGRSTGKAGGAHQWWSTAHRRARDTRHERGAGSHSRGFCWAAWSATYGCDLDLGIQIPRPGSSSQMNHSAPNPSISRAHTTHAQNGTPKHHGGRVQHR